MFLFGARVRWYFGRHPAAKKRLMGQVGRRLFEHLSRFVLAREQAWDNAGDRTVVRTYDRRHLRVLEELASTLSTHRRVEVVFLFF